MHASRVGRRARLRPLQLGELFDLSLRVYRTFGLRIMAASALPTLFTLAGFAFVFQYILPSFLWTREGASQATQVGQTVANLLLGIVVAGPLILIGVSLVTAYAAPVVASFMHGLPPDFKAAQGIQWKLAPKLTVASLGQAILGAGGALVGCGLLVLSWSLSGTTSQSSSIAGVVLILAILAIALGGIGALVVVSMHALVAPITALEGLRPGAAAKRSRQLMKSRLSHGSGYDRVWALYVLVGFIGFVMMVGAEVLWEVAGIDNWADQLNLQAYKPILDTFLALAPPYLTLLVTIPVWAVTVTIIYFERRVRLEGYDIEALAADVWKTGSEDGLRVGPVP